MAWRLLIVDLSILVLIMPLKAGAPSGDLKKMQGTWQGTVLEVGGQPSSAGERKIKVKLLVKGERYTIFFDEMKFTEGTMKLDETKKPKSLDAMPLDGEFKGKIQPGIYQLEGDELKVVFAEPGKDRPKDFKTREKTEEVMVSYRRVKGK